MLYTRRQYPTGKHSDYLIFSPNTYIYIYMYMYMVNLVQTLSLYFLNIFTTPIITLIYLIYTLKPLTSMHPPTGKNPLTYWYHLRINTLWGNLGSIGGQCNLPMNRDDRAHRRILLTCDINLVYLNSHKPADTHRNTLVPAPSTVTSLWTRTSGNHCGHGWAPT